ncbi:unnamed protein product, partial [Heterosigma akashiwo]
ARDAPGGPSARAYAAPVRPHPEAAAEARGQAPVPDRGRAGHQEAGQLAEPERDGRPHRRRRRRG